MEFAMIEHWREQSCLEAHMKAAHVKEFMEKGKELRERINMVISTYKSCGI